MYDDRNGVCSGSKKMWKLSPLFLFVLFSDQIETFVLSTTYTLQLARLGGCLCILSCSNFHETVGSAFHTWHPLPISLPLSKHISSTPKRNLPWSLHVSNTIVEIDCNIASKCPTCKNIFWFWCTVLCFRASVLPKQFIGKNYTGWFAVPSQQ